MQRGKHFATCKPLPVPISDSHPTGSTLAGHIGSWNKNRLGGVPRGGTQGPSHLGLIPNIMLDTQNFQKSFVRMIKKTINYKAKKKIFANP